MAKRTKQHTPGPWRIGNGGMGVFPPKGEFAKHPRTIADCKTAEDARLIAAAPLLYAAAKQVLDDATDRGEVLDPETDEYYEDYRKLAEAIAVAEGRHPATEEGA
jgi:hypothetical protein